MAAPTYTTDLVDIDLCEAGGKTWAEPLASGWTLGAGPTSNDDDAIQGSLSMAKAFNAVGVGGMMVNNGAGITLPTDGAFLGWFIWACPGSLYSDADGGIRIMVGTDLSNFLSWDVGGSTTYVYGGWTNFAVNTTITPDDTVGTGLGNSQYVGAAVNNFNSIFKGSPFVSDAYRYGRCEARMSGGEIDNYATFSGYAAVNDATSARWGLIQATAGGYLWKGKMLFGFSTVATTYRARATNVATLTTGVAHGFKVGDTLTMTGIGGTGYNVTATVASVPSTTTFTYANTGDPEGSTADTGGSIDGVVDFSDSSKTIFIQNTSKVTSTFNKIEVRNASTIVDWTGVSFVCLSPSTTASKGDFEVVDSGADVNFDGCAFTDMNTFIFGSNSSVINSSFIRCGLITGGGGIFNNSKILTSTVAADEGAFYYDAAVDPDGELDGMTFSMGTNAHHAIDFGTNVTESLGSITLRGIEFTGFGSTGDSNDSTVRFLATTGSLTLNLVGCTVNGSVATTSNFSVDDAAGITVTVSIDPVTLSIHVQDINTEAAIVGARVWIPVTSTASGRPFNQTINTILVQTDPTYRVTFAAAHNLATNDYLHISGCDQPEYNKTFQVTFVDSTKVDITVSGSPDAATGTIVGKWVIINNVTNESGDISASYTYAESQPISGRVRLSSGPYYKTAPISGTVSSSSGLAVTVQMIPDS